MAKGEEFLGLTYQANCIDCNRPFGQTGRHCNICKEVIRNQCFQCHNFIHRYNHSEQHGLVNRRFVHALIGVFYAFGIGVTMYALIGVGLL